MNTRSALARIACLMTLCAQAFSQAIPLPPLPESLSEQARAQLAGAASAPGAAPMTAAQMRAFADQFQQVWSARQKTKYAVTIADDVIAGVPVRKISPAAQADTRRIFLNLHGGGFQLDSGSSTENIPIAALTGIPVVAVRYRLAPENPFPAAVNDALAVYRVLLKSHQAKDIAVYGTSAGAVLGPELIARIIAEKLPVPAALGVFSGDTDLARMGDSPRLFPLLVGTQDYAAVLAAYAGSTPLTNPAISPLYVDLTGFPPTLCITSGRDVLQSGTVNLCRRLDRDGVRSHLVVYDGLPHAFWTYLDTPESDEAYKAMADFFVRRLDATPVATRASAAPVAEPDADSSARCAALMKLALADTSITSPKAANAGPFKSEALPIEVPVPAACRVQGRISPSPDSDIRFEVWLPLAGWTGRMYGAGNGGFAGGVSYVPGLAGAVQRGAVGISTDTGHTGGAEDGSWAQGHPERLKDYGYRAIHLSTLNAKAIAAAFYGKAPTRAYFTSCSNGGRQGLMEAQRYPEDYDGIIAGAPAYDWTGVAANFIWNTRALRTPGAAIPIAKVPLVQAAVLKACSSNGQFVENPQTCKFDPKVLLCSNGDADSCLTAPQVDTLRKIYAGPHNASGKAIYPGFSASGGEVGAPPGNGWDGWMLPQTNGTSHQERYPREMLAYFTTTLKTDLEHFDFERDFPAFQSELGPIIDATDANLKPFADRGGKLILWHGWADPGLPPLRTVQYYEHVRTTMGAKNADKMVRLFMLPGVQHCLGGPGPNSFGQYGVPTKAADPREDMSAALERWVETGVAPDELLARHTANALAPAYDSGLEPTGKAQLICAYPKMAASNGGASSVSEARCVSPAARNSH